MPTFSGLGLKITGNYITGEKEGIVINSQGAEYLNDRFPSVSGNNFSEGNPVVLTPKLPRQETTKTQVRATFRGNEGNVTQLVYFETDDWFTRKER